MKSARLLLAVLIVLLVRPLPAQVPQIINYQGRIGVGATSFHGTGSFKFALVNAAGTTTYWSNDGTSTGGSQPTASVALTVTKGLYSVLLGDVSLANMTAIPVSVFTNPDVRLRIWFNDSVNGSQLLTPDQRIAPVGYAVMAGSVPDGAITSAKIAGGAVGAAQLGNGAVTATNLATGAAAANLNASGQALVPTGGTIFSANPADSNLLNAGYVFLGRMETGDVWEPLTPASPPTKRAQHTAVWTGTKMIVWGGTNGTELGTGALYDPATNTWTATATIGAPGGRHAHTAIWTGTEMIIFGGLDGNTFAVGGGSRYNPNTNDWDNVGAGGLGGRVLHTAVWTGTRMIVWGGSPILTAEPLNDGARYNPTNDTWTPTATAGAPTVRKGHTAVWTGSEMIVWGGEGVGEPTNTGARYSATTDTWTAMTTTSAPTARLFHCAVWTGTEMLVWGGTDTLVGSTGDLDYFNDGGRYNPTTNTWTALTSAGAPSARTQHTAVWNGTEMLVWGGVGANGVIDRDGGRYNPTTGAWVPITTTGPASRTQHTAIWTGTGMLTFGGTDNVNYFSDTYNYLPVRTLYLYQRP